MPVTTKKILPSFRHRLVVMVTVPHPPINNIVGLDDTGPVFDPTPHRKIFGSWISLTNDDDGHFTPLPNNDTHTRIERSVGRSTRMNTRAESRHVIYIYTICIKHTYRKHHSFIPIGINKKLKIESIYWGIYQYFLKMERPSLIS